MNNSTGQLYFYPKEHLSISALNAFENCPFSFYMNYYLGYKTPEKDNVRDGKQFQEVLNAKYKGLDTKAKIDEMAPKSRGIATLLLGKAYDFDKENIVSVDEPYKVDLGFGIPMMFVPDLLLKDRIIENKYTTGYYNADMVQKERQRVVYYLGVKKTFGYKPEVYYQLFNTKKKSCELVPAPVCTEDIEGFMDWVEDKLKKIEAMYNTGKYDFGTHKFCDYKDVCPLNEKYGFQR